MKKCLKLLTVPLLTLSVLGVTSCNGSSTTSTTPATSLNTSNVPTDADLVFYFYRFDEDYSDVCAWLWGDSLPAVAMKFTEGEKVKKIQLAQTGSWNWLQVEIYFDQVYDTNVYSDWNMSSATSVTMTADQWKNIIIRDAAGNKDVGDDRTVDLTKVDSDGVIRFWSITQNPTFYYDVNDVPTTCIREAYFSDSEQVHIDLYYAMEDYKFEDFTVVDDQNKNYALRSGLNFSNFISLVLEEKYTDYTKPLYLKHQGTTYPISYRGVYKSNDFNDKYEYTGKDLGAVVSTDNSSTTFKLWSPSATEVTLNIYDSATSSGIKETYKLTLGEKGVWSHTISRDLNGTYYTYTVKVLGQTNAEVGDPYASSSNANGARSMVVNWGRVSTALSGSAPTVTTPSSVSVLEMHVRDFTAHSSWNGDSTKVGKYTGLSTTGTTLGGDASKPTGFDYVKSLGVSHIQLQPVYDFNSVDETKLNDTAYKTAHRNGIYNWGYDPYCYSSLEGSYSSNPNDGFARINEFREVTNAYNAAGIGVIMDVVYNHMPSESNSTYAKIMPDYYFRTNSYSGAGTDLASENAMVKNMIIQTTEQLARRYNLAGFRFDLMGLITKEAMEEVDANLRSFDSDIVLYGEGWNMYGGDKYLGNDDQGVQGAFKNYYENQEAKIGFFNDFFRDGIKGNVFTDTDKGFLQRAYDGTTDSLATLKGNVNRGLYGTQTGAITRWSNHFSGVSVNYVEAHDNLTLHDKLYATNPELTEEVRNNLQAYATSVTALSSGVAFFQIGQEFARSKEMPATWLTGENAVNEKYTTVEYGGTTRYFVNDSYNFSDEINAIDWNLPYTNASMVASFKRDLALRNSTDMNPIKPLKYDNTVFTTLSYEGVGVTESDFTRMIGYTVSETATTGEGQSATTTTTKKLAIVLNFASTAATISNALTTGATKYYLNGTVTSTFPTSLPSLSYLVVLY